MSRPEEFCRPESAGRPLHRWTLYVLLCADSSLYTGVTTDLGRRFGEHMDGRAAKYTRARRPVHIAAHVPCDSKSEALKAEIKVKKLTRPQKVKLIAALSTVWTRPQAIKELLNKEG